MSPAACNQHSPQVCLRQLLENRGGGGSQRHLRAQNPLKPIPISHLQHNPPRQFPFPVDAASSPPVRCRDYAVAGAYSEGNSMPEGYCVKCKAKKEIADAVEELMKNGRKAIKGKCPTCGVVMFKMLGGKPSSNSVPSESSTSAA